MYRWKVESNDGYLVEGFSDEYVESFLDLKGHALAHGVPVSISVFKDDSCVYFSKFESIEELELFEEDWDV